MKKGEMITDLTQGSVTKCLVRFAIPFSFAMLLQTAYSIVDMIVVGHYVGTAGISAVSNGGNILSLFTFLGIGLGNAGQTAISQLVGKGDRDAVSRMVGTMFSSILVLAVIVTAICCCFTGTFLTWLGVPQEAFDLAYSYLMTCFCGMFFIFGYNLVSAIFRGIGDSQRPLVFVAIAAVTNIILDLFLVGLLNMETLGAALGTVISQGLSFIIALIFLSRKRAQFVFDFRLRSFRPDKACLRTLCKLGIPMALQHTAVSLSVLFVTSYINSFGVTASAVTGVGNKLQQVVFVVTNGLNMAGTSIIGQSFGARKHNRVKQTVGAIFAISFAFCGILSILIVLFPEQVFSIFDNSPAVLAMSHTYVPIAVLNFIGESLRVPYIAFINGIGYPGMNFFMGILDGIIMRVGLAMLLGLVLGMGIFGFWLGSTLAGFAYGLLITPYFLRGRWKNRKLVVQNI